VHELYSNAQAGWKKSKSVNDARAGFTIRAKARPGDAWRFRLLQCLGGPRPPVARSRFRAIIYKPERLGDLFLAANAIRILAAHWGESQTALVVSAECRELADKMFPDLPKFYLPLTLGLGGWNLAQALSLRSKLSSWSCEHLVCLQHHRQPLSSAALRWIRADCRWGVTGHPWMLPAIRDGEAGLFDRPLQYRWPTPPGTPAEVQAHADLVTRITGRETDVTSILPKVALPSEHRVSSERPTLVVVPWGSGEIKNLIGELIAGVIKDATSVARCRIRIVAEPKRRSEQARLTKDLSAMLPGFDIAPLPTANLAELEAAIAQSAAVLAADTFPAHLATAMNKPVAVLATGALPGVFGPWSRSENQRWFCREMACWGCGWRCQYEKPYCLLDISTKDVGKFLAPHLAA
jgi:ADP-heptose:LPS heptosyltransferase